MTAKQVMGAVVPAAALTWSTVMTMPGQPAAVAVLPPSLGPLIQQIASASSGTDTPSRTTPAPNGSEAPSL
ncbi:hypothetical protein ACGFYV_35790 [Streptomyces sp. NPDC048297]|uniref:hypothetical protein n=1 Tax=Streptomyces sp. NPDC048297 TaxID=3365531 RepID=UPI003711C3F2